MLVSSAEIDKESISEFVPFHAVQLLVVLAAFILLVLLGAFTMALVELMQMAVDTTNVLVWEVADNVLETADTESVLVLFWPVDRLASCTNDRACA